MPYYRLYKDTSGQWRWSYHSNSRIIAVSSESYVNKSDAERGIEIMKSSTNSPVV